MRGVAQFTVLFVALVSIPLEAYSQELSEVLDARQARVKEFCEENPTHVKCDKFLDAKYRRHTDAERQDRKEKMEAYRSRQSQRSAVSELRAMCRQYPDSRRCQKLKKRPGTL